MTGGGVIWSIDEYCSTKLNQQLLLLKNTSNRFRNLDRDRDRYDNIIRYDDDDDDYWSTVLSFDENENNNKNNDVYNNEMNRRFLTALNLPAIHPFCVNKSNFMTSINHNNNDNTGTGIISIPPMGSLDIFKEIKGTGTAGEATTTLFYMIAPALLAMGELWLRLFAGFFGPIGTLYLSYYYYYYYNNRNQNHIQIHTNSLIMIPFVITLTVSSTLVLMTDTLYVLQNGPLYGLFLFLTSIYISIRICLNRNLQITSIIVSILFILSIHLITTPTTTLNSNSDSTARTSTIIHFGNPMDDVQIQDRLYYNNKNKYVSKIVHNWPNKYYMYDKEHGATSWMPTGDSRTGLPFILNKHNDNDDEPKWIRVFLEVNDNENENNNDDNDNDSDNDNDNSSEYIAIDISFPTNTTTDITTNDGHHGVWTTTKPIYFVLHGLHGGTNEEYIRDLTIRRNVEGSIVIVMIARGIMDTPIKGWNIFHGARTSDVHTAVTTIRKNLLTQKQQNHNPPLFIGVGYSMGAIIMSNYVATYGPECALDAAIAISGGLDMRYQKHAYRTQRLWQPMLAGSLRQEFLLGKFGHRVKAKLSNYQFLQILRASHITEIDQYAIVPLNGFDDLDHYYREMSALGDIPHLTGSASTPSSNNYKFHNISIPLLVVHALDDPLLSWRATVQNDVDGFMHPTNLVQSGSGNVLLLLTKSGGHVGWPLGLLPWKEKWRWMSDLVMSFATSVDEVRSAVAESSAPTTTTATTTTTTTTK